MPARRIWITSSKATYIEIFSNFLSEFLNSVAQCESTQHVKYKLHVQLFMKTILSVFYNHAHTFIWQISSHGTPCDLSRAVTDLNTRANQLSRTVFTDYDGFLNAFDVIFDASSVVTSASRNAASASTVNMVGRIAVTASLSNSHYGS